ncbi:putative disease resistance RPP13-like protein 1 [Tripterygium wilfordii]|uniref:Putative disease resistance RPP13-like protein 1 n=1 Tax=Tripterygium wilfordii TaxID=458696 RepID=A0A7J7DSN8_TRIWF|nr:putative disease resistance RPP13-like protein 1 [Tripterygium wilfordii]
MNVFELVQKWTSELNPSIGGLNLSFLTSATVPISNLSTYPPMPFPDPSPSICRLSLTLPSSTSHPITSTARSLYRSTLTLSKFADFQVENVGSTRNRSEKDNLVQMWVAEGLVVQEKRRAIWDVGRNYFNDLLGRSFFYASDLVGYRQQYKMHGLLHKLAELISSDLCFRVEDTKMEMKLLGKHKGAQHSSLTCSDFFQPSSLEPFHRFKRLRTFMLDGLEGEIVDSGFFKKLKHLRTLHFRGLDMRFIPDAIEHLIHLRYLDGSYSKIEELPRGIAKIIGLQTIKLRGCKNLRRLPKNMKKLIELQHLELGKGMSDVGGLKAFPDTTLELK